MSIEFNKFQIAVKNDYGGGNFAHVEDLEDVKLQGDTLFQFIMIELATSEGCDSTAEAVRRLEAAQRDLEHAISSIEGTI